MNSLDIIIIVCIVISAVLGFKRGFTNSAIKSLGGIAELVLAYLLKNPVSLILYDKLPFLRFGMIKNTDVINVFVYEVLAFLICLIAFSLIRKILSGVTSIFEKFLTATIVLGIPSKIIGAVVGALACYIWLFLTIYLYIMIWPGAYGLENSKLATKILYDTPVLSAYSDKSLDVLKEFNELKNAYDDKTISEDEYTYEAFDLFIKYDFIKIETLEKLVSKGKVAKFQKYDELINKYKPVENNENIEDVSNVENNVEDNGEIDGNNE